MLTNLSRLRLSCMVIRAIQMYNNNTYEMQICSSVRNNNNNKYLFVNK